MPPVFTFDPETPTIADLRFMYYGGGAGSTVSDSEYDYLLGAYLQNIQADDILMLGYNGNGSPEGVVFAPRGAMYSDLATGSKYNKTTVETLNTGWVLGSAGGGGGGVVNTIVAGPGISVNNTNPAAPIITAEVPQTEFDAHVNSVTAHAAVNLTFPTGTGGIAATNVQAAIVAASTMGPAGSGMAATLIDAQGVLGGVIDNTPLFFPVGVNQVFGRSAAGNVGAQTTAQLAAMFGTPTGTKFLADDGTLKTPAGGGSVTFPLFNAASAGTDALEFQVTGDTYLRFVLNHDGSMEWGDGITSTNDVTLQRAAAGILAVGASGVNDIWATNFRLNGNGLVTQASLTGAYLQFLTGSSMLMQTRAVGIPTVVVKAMASQTAALMDFQGSGGNSMVAVNGDGKMYFNGISANQPYIHSGVIAELNIAHAGGYNNGGIVNFGGDRLFNANYTFHVAGGAGSGVVIRNNSAAGTGPMSRWKASAGQVGEVLLVTDSADAATFKILAGGQIVVPTGNNAIQFGNTAVALQYSFNVFTTIVGSADRTAVGTGGAASAAVFTIYGSGTSGAFAQYIPLNHAGGLGLVIKAAAAATGAYISLRDSADVTMFTVRSSGSIGKAGAIEQRYNTVAASGATESIDVSLFGVHDITMDQNCTFTFDNAPPVGECSSFMLTLRGAFTPTLPASIKWADGVAPSYVSPTILVFTRDTAGSFWMGSRIGKAFA